MKKTHNKNSVEKLSKCCNAKVEYQGRYGGKSYFWYCKKCSKRQDLIKTPNNSPEEWKIPPKRVAMNIVNQLFDLAKITVKDRQAINDECDDFVEQIIKEQRHNAITSVLEELEKGIEELCVKFIDKTVKDLMFQERPKEVKFRKSSGKLLANFINVKLQEIKKRYE